MIRLCAFTVAGALLLGGCRSPERDLPYPIAISEAGVGPIHSGESFDAQILQGKLPGFTIEKLSRISTEEKAEVILELKRADAVLAYILSDESGEKIDQISVISPLITNRDYPLVGQKPSIRNLRCEGELCRYPDDPSIRYRLGQDGTIREIIYQKL